MIYSLQIYWSTWLDPDHHPWHFMAWRKYKVSLRGGSGDLKKLNNDVKNVKKVAAAYEALTKQILLESGRKKVRI